MDKIWNFHENLKKYVLCTAEPEKLIKNEFWIGFEGPTGWPEETYSHLGFNNKAI